MVRTDKTLIADLRKRFKFLCNDPRVLGVVLYGSYAIREFHKMSDIDICIVAPSQDHYSIYKTYASSITGNIDKLDIRFFDELPLLIRGEIIEQGIVLCTKDMGELSEHYYFSTRKELADHRYRMNYI